MSDEALALLRVIVAGERAAVARALHPRATLHRADGSVVRGREAVIDALCVESDEPRYTPCAVDGDALVIALQVKGIPGEVRFSLRGELAQGRLITVRVRA